MRLQWRTPGGPPGSREPAGSLSATAAASAGPRRDPRPPPRSPAVQAQLAEALTLISQTDFPKRWPDLLPQLVAQLRDHADDYNALYGALTSANSISKRFRQGEVLAGDLNEELRLCQEAFGGPLLDIARGVTAQVQGNPGASRESLTNPLRCARLAFRIWYSLNYFGLSEMEVRGDVMLPFA